MDSIATLRLQPTARRAFVAQPQPAARPRAAAPAPAAPTRSPGGATDPGDGFVRGKDARQVGAAKMLGLLGNAGHTTQILDAKAGLLRRDGEISKADELTAIKEVYEKVGRADNGRGNCCSATTAMLKAMKERFGPSGPESWKIESIGVGDQGDGSFAHQAVAITEKGKDKPSFVLDPTRMPMIKLPFLAGQGSTDAWDQAYSLSEFLRTRQNNYGDGWSLGVP